MYKYKALMGHIIKTLKRKLETCIYLTLIPFIFFSSDKLSVLNCFFHNFLH